MTKEEYCELIRLSNEIHRKTITEDCYIIIPNSWLEEEDDND